MSAPKPENESARLEVLHQFEILDTDPEESLDEITRLAAHLCHTPIAVITLIDAHRQWFKSRVGLTPTETARDISFCAHAIMQPGPLVVRDALDDDRFRHNPMVTSDPYIRFYAGSPLISIEGYNLGTLCVIDRTPREITPEQVAALRILSNQVMTQLELRRTINFLTHSLNNKSKRVEELEAQLQAQH
jgi:GAF domain-containing protein